MALHPACHTVENYLAAWFPGGVIKEFEWTAKRCWAFEVRVPTLTFHLLVSTQFLDQAHNYETERLLHDWNVATRMRMAGSKKWVYLTPSGVSLGVPAPS